MAEEVEQKRLVQLTPARMQEASFVRNHWVITAEHGSTQEDLLNPAYWAHVSVRLKPWDEITVRADDGTFWAHILVTGCDRTWAHVKVMSWVNLSTGDVSQSVNDRYLVEWGGPYDKWRVKRTEDNSVVAKNLSKTDAILKKAEFEKA